MSTEKLLINLHASWGRSRANGPGVRSVIWVQGCSLACPGCHNPRTWKPEMRSVCSVESVLDWYRGQADVRGMTFSGGEPFEQALALSVLARAVHALGGDVLVFSGFERAQLEADIRPHARALLAETDLLVDGPYRRDQPTRSPLRSSDNQRLHFLGHRIGPQEIVDLPRAEWWGSESGARMTGFRLGA